MKFLVGIDGVGTVDPEYWLDHCEWIEATSKKDAVRIYTSRKKNWLQKGEEKLVEVLGATDDSEPPTPRVFLREDFNEYRDVS